MTDEELDREIDATTAELKAAYARLAQINAEIERIKRDFLIE